MLCCKQLYKKPGPTENQPPRTIRKDEKRELCKQPGLRLHGPAERPNSSCRVALYSVSLLIYPPFLQSCSVEPRPLQGCWINRGISWLILLAHRSAKEHLERATRRVCRVGATKKCEPFGENGIRHYIVKCPKGPCSMAQARE